MNINIKHEEGVSILELTGDVDLSCSPEARKHILEALQDNKNLLINLANIGKRIRRNPGINLSQVSVYL